VVTSIKQSPVFKCPVKISCQLNLFKEVTHLKRAIFLCPFNLLIQLVWLYVLNMLD